MKNLSKEQKEQLKDEFLKELLNSVPIEVLESLKEDIDEAIKGQEEKKLSQEEEYELIEKIEQTVIRFVMDKSEDLSVNGTILLMFKLMLGIDEALKDSLGDQYNYYRSTIEKTVMGEDNK